MFLKPFTTKLWLSLIATVVFITLSLHLLAWVSPYGAYEVKKVRNISSNAPVEQFVIESGERKLSSQLDFRFRSMAVSKRCLLSDVLRFLNLISLVCPDDSSETEKCARADAHTAMEMMLASLRCNSQV